MEKNLLQLLEKIEINKNNYSFFNTGKLLKIVGNKDKTIYNFNFELENQLPIDIYIELEKLIRKTFNTINNTRITIYSRENNYEFVSYYYRYFIDELSSNSSLLSMFKRLPLNINENVLNVTLNNKAEEIKFKSISKILEDKFENVGYNLKIKTSITDEKENTILEEIKSDLIIKVPIIEKKETMPVCKP